MRHEPNQYSLLCSFGRRLTGLLVLYFVWLSAGFAQTGPGGVGNSTDNRLWLRADSITAGDILSGNVASWRDMSGNGNNLSQGTTARQPEFRTNTLKGFPVVQFDRSNTEFLSGSLGSTLNAPFTILSVVRFTNTTGYSYLLNIGNSGTNTNVSISRDHTPSYNSYYCYTGGGGYYDAPQNALPPNVDRIINAIHTSAGDHILYFDGVGQALTSSGSPGILNPTSAINIGRSSSGTNYMDGYTPEMIVFNRELNSAERKIVENYLAAKYGLTIPHDLYDYESTHYYDVAGIGQETSAKNLAARSAGILQIDDASDLGNNDFLLFGHQNGAIDSWSVSGAPSDTILILPRNWRFDHRGNVGTVTVLIDFSLLPSTPGACSERYIYIDSDGDFTSGAVRHQLTNFSGDQYTVSGISINKGDYITIGVGAMPDADAGDDDSACGLSYQLNATPSIGRGKWTLVNGAGNVVSWTDTDPTTTVIVDAIGDYTFRWTETAGNCSDSDEVIISFGFDDEDPVIIDCPTNIVQANDAGNCGAVVSWTEPTATDNCTASGSLVWTKSHLPGSVFTVGTTTVFYTVEDASGNDATCSFTVTVTDDENPTITCPGAVTGVTSDNGTGDCTTTVVLGTPATSDNCSVASVVAQVGGVTIDPATYLFPIGVTTVTWIVTDGSGNTSQCTQSVTVTDDENPVITCPEDMTINCDDDTTPANTGIATATDNCAAAANITITYTDVSTQGTNPANADYYNYTITRTWRATDPSGNTSTCEQVITVQDVTPPVVICKDATIYLDVETGIATLTPDIIDGGSYDNCSPLIFSLSKSTFDCTEIGTHLVWLYVADVSGNIDSCLANVTVEYLIPPVPTVTVTDTIICNNTFTEIVLGNSFENMTFKWNVVAGPEITGYSTDSLRLPYTIADQLLNSSNEVKSVTYTFTPFAYGLCPLPDTTITVYVQPTPRLTVSIPDTIVCDSTEINITVNDGNGAVAGNTTKVYELTTTDAGGAVIGVQTSGEYLAGTPITNTLINTTNAVQVVTYHFKARIRDDRPGREGFFCDQGGDTTITVYVQPTPRLTVSIPDTIVCDSTEINITVNDGNGDVAGSTTKVYELTTTDAGGAVLGVQTSGEYLAGTPITNTLINTTNAVQVVTYHFKARIRDDRPGREGFFCDQGGDTIIIVYVNPTPQFTVSVDDTIVCDFSTVELIVTDDLGNVLGGKVYDLTTVYTPGAVSGVLPDGTYPITQNVVNTLINNTNEFQTIRYNLRYRLTDTRYGGIAFCDHGIDTTIVIYLEPTAKLVATIDNDTICNDGTINISWTTPTIPVTDIVFNVTVINPYPEITNYTGGFGLTKLDEINNSLNNSGDTARMIMYVFSPVLLDVLGNQKCSGINDTVRVWINPTPRAIPVVETERMCTGAITSVLMTSPTVMTKGYVIFDYSVTLTGNPGDITGNTDPGTSLQPGERIRFNYTNSSDTIQSVFFNITPRATDLGCANGLVIPAEVKVHALPIQDLIVTNPVMCTGGSDGALMAILSKGADPYGIVWNRPYSSQNPPIVATVEGTSTFELDSLQEGLHRVVVTDFLGCVNEISFTLVRPRENVIFAALPKSGSSYSLTCPGGNDGNILFYITEGYSFPFSYRMLNEAGDTLFQGTIPGNYSPANPLTYRVFGGLPAGEYFIHLEDVNNCQTNYYTEVKSPPPLEIVLDAHEYEGGYNVTCRGHTNGSAWAVVTGGNTGSRIYEWSTTPGFLPTTVLVGDRIENIGAGVWYFRVTDSRGCTATSSITLIEPDGIELIDTTLSWSADNAYNISCHGGTDGSISLEFGGGTGPYIYNWVTYPAGANIAPGLKDQTGLIAGVYELLVVDANGCDRLYSFTLTEPDSLIITPTLSLTFDNAYNINCFGGTGAINLAVTGGSEGNYTYLWSTENGSGIVQGDRDQSALTAGTYSVQVTDFNGCTAIIDTTLTQPDPIQITLVPTHITCASPGFDNGSVDLIVTGGSGNYSFEWSNGATTEDINGLTQNEYSVIVTDTYGCQAFDTVFVSNPPDLTLDIARSDFGGFNISCFGLSNGWLEVIPVTGDAPFTYQWTGPDGFTSTDSRITNLRAGDYIISVIDRNLCTATEVVEVTQPGRIDMTVNLSQTTGGMHNINCYGSSTGTITLSAVNAVGVTQWLWSDGATGSARTDLPAGNYTVVLIDENNCAVDTTINLTQPDSMIISFTVTQPLCPEKPDGDIITEVVGGVPLYNYLWNDNSTQKDRLGVTSGLYILTVTDLNGCIAIDSVELEPEKELCLEIPNAFSPDGDLINDYWNIGMIYLYPNMEVTIFNRWGETVWKSERGYPVPWDGRSNGKSLPIDSYHYIINLNNGRKPVLGNVTIVR